MQIVKNGVDWSAGELTGEQLIEAGEEFAGRYLSKDWRGLRQSEVDSFRANKIGLIIIGEYDTIDSDGDQISAMLGGAEKGRNQALYADSIRKERGLPDLQPIFFTLDVPPGVVPWTSVRSYMLSAADALGGKQRVGMYSGYDGVAFSVDNDLADYHWQCSAWSNGRLHPKAMIYQYDIFGNFIHGIDVDLNKAFVENYGQTQAFEHTDPPAPIWIPAVHPEWFAQSLSVRYPSVGRWDWNGQTIVLDPIRHNAHTRRNTWQYAEPRADTAGHAGPKLEVGAKVNVERIGDVADVHGRDRTWVLTGNGTWIPEDTLDLDFSIVRRKKRS